MGDGLVTDPGWRVVNAGYASMCAVCREGDRSLVALPFASALAPSLTGVWLCRTCALGAMACFDRAELSAACARFEEPPGLSLQSVTVQMGLRCTACSQPRSAHQPWNRGKARLLHTPTPGFADGDLRRCSRCGDPRDSHSQKKDGSFGRCAECECTGYEA